jgi:hypothetical protein
MAGTLAGAREAPDRVVESQRTFWVRLVIGAFLIALYAAWAPQVWQQELRSVTAEQLRADLAAGEIRVFAVLPRDYENDAWPVDLAGGSAGGFDTHPEAGGTVGYLTTGDQIRLVAGIEEVQDDFRGLVEISEPTPLSETLVSELRAAGVPQRGGLVPDSWTEPEVYGVPLGALALLAVILGPAPRRGNRWFWFWVIGTPLGLGVLAYAVLELLPPGVTGQTSGAALARLGRPHRHAPGGRCGDGRPGTAARRLRPPLDPG